MIPTFSVGDRVRVDYAGVKKEHWQGRSIFPATVLVVEDDGLVVRMDPDKEVLTVPFGCVRAGADPPTDLQRGDRVWAQLEDNSLSEVVEVLEAKGDGCVVMYYSPKLKIKRIPMSRVLLRATEPLSEGDYVFDTRDPKRPLVLTGENGPGGWVVRDRIVRTAVFPEHLVRDGVMSSDLDQMRLDCFLTEPGWCEKLMAPFAGQPVEEAGRPVDRDGLVRLAVVGAPRGAVPEEHLRQSRAIRAPRDDPERAELLRALARMMHDS